jgi:DNA-binding transcriptional MerR regulator
MNGVELAAHVGVTYRQVDFWTRKGWLRPTNAAPGSGIGRVYPPAEVALAARMAALLKAGLAVQVAARVARGEAAAAETLRLVLEACA